MYTLLVFTTIGTAFGIYAAFRFKEIVLSVVGAFAGFVVALVIGLLIGAFAPMHWHETGTWQLRSVRTSDGTTGAFVWGTGSVDEATYYRVLVVNANGSASPFAIKANVNNTEILEKEDLQDTGELKILEYRSRSDWFLDNWALVPWEIRTYYKLSVPKGSVRTEFTVQ